MKLIQTAIVLCFFVFTLGCTAGGGGGGFSSIFTESSKDSSTKETQKQIEDIQSKINTDPNYALSTDEAVFLSEQGVIADKSDLNGWVK